MVRLADIQKQADVLSQEDRAKLLSHLLNSLEKTPQGPNDKEVLERDKEFEARDIPAISHDQFIRESRPDHKRYSSQ